MPYSDDLTTVCRAIEQNLTKTTPALCEAFGLLHGHPWCHTAQDIETTYYSCLYELVKRERPRSILEIGTGFGLSTAALLSAAAQLNIFISMDIGTLGRSSGIDNIAYAKSKIYGGCSSNGISPSRVHFFNVNTQPTGGDNEGAGGSVATWHTVPRLVRLLQSHSFDVLFIDGKHTEDGLLSDLESFWPFVRPGGLVVCDDLHDPDEYAGRFVWVPDTWGSFHAFIAKHEDEIAGSYIWNFPSVYPGGRGGLRPFGVLRKGRVGGGGPSPGFGTFDNANALSINIARLDHLASLGLDIYRKSVLETGAGVGRLTGFFERLGCYPITSIDAREENLAENLRRHPWRHGGIDVVDMDVPGSLAPLTSHDIVFCYGTLYHLRYPGMALREMAALCNDMLLLETCVQHDGAQQSVVATQENHLNPNQSFHGVGSLPTRRWVFDQLARLYPYVYLPLAQPNHPEFPTEWGGAARGNLRSIFVASRHSLDRLNTLGSSILDSQIRLADAR